MRLFPYGYYVASHRLQRLAASGDAARNCRKLSRVKQVWSPVLNKPASAKIGGSIRLVTAMWGSGDGGTSK